MCVREKCLKVTQLYKNVCFVGTHTHLLVGLLSAYFLLFGVGFPEIRGECYLVDSHSSAGLCLCVWCENERIVKQKREKDMRKRRELGEEATTTTTITNQDKRT